MSYRRRKATVNQMTSIDVIRGAASFSMTSIDVIRGQRVKLKGFLRGGACYTRNVLLRKAKGLGAPQMIIAPSGRRPRGST